MRTLLFGLVLLITVFLSGCEVNRFHSQTMEDYLNEYEITNIHFSEHTKLSTYGWEIYVTTGELNNQYNQETESMDWALGENIAGKLVLIYVPLNSRYDIVVETIPFPSIEELNNEINQVNDNTSSICNVTINLNNGLYGEFLSIYEADLIGNEFFDNELLTSSYLVEIGMCSTNDHTYNVGMIYISNEVVLIAYEDFNEKEPTDIDIFKLGTIQ